VITVPGEDAVVDLSRRRDRHPDPGSRFSVATRWGSLVGEPERRGLPLPVIDSLIAATSVCHSLTVVTRNTQDFELCGARCISPLGRLTRSYCFGLDGKQQRLPAELRDQALPDVDETINTFAGRPGAEPPDDPDQEPEEQNPA